MKKSQIKALYRDLRSCWNLDTPIYICKYGCGVNTDPSVGLTKGTEGYLPLLDYVTETGNIRSNKFKKDIGYTFNEWYAGIKDELDATIACYLEGRTDDEDEEYYG